MSFAKPVIVRLDEAAWDLLAQPLEPRTETSTRVRKAVREADVVIDPQDQVVKNRFGPEGDGATIHQIENSTLVQG